MRSVTGDSKEWQIVSRLNEAVWGVLQSRRTTLTTLDEGDCEDDEAGSEAAPEASTAEMAAAKQCAAELLRTNTLVEEIAFPSGAHFLQLPITSCYCQDPKRVLKLQRCLS